jgi:hypothetical protein
MFSVLVGSLLAYFSRVTVPSVFACPGKTESPIVSPTFSPLSQNTEEVI